MTLPTRPLLLCAALLAATTASPAEIRTPDGPMWLDPIEVPASRGLVARCFTSDFLSVAVAPEMPRAEMEALRDAMASRQRYQINSRWYRTALDGPVTPLQERVTITWSFVPDGTPIRRITPLGQLSDETSPSQLFAAMNGVGFFAGEAQWRDLFRQSFDRWGDFLGVDYIETVDDGAAMGAPGEEGVRGDVRVSMIPLDGAIQAGGGILAYNIFPVPEPVPPQWPDNLGTGAGGDMVLDADDVIFFATDINNLNWRPLRNVVMHEHGHGLGYLHVNPIIGTKLMEAAFTGEFDGPQEDDIRGGQFQYGDHLEPNSAPADATPLGAIDQDGPWEFENLAIENAAAADYFAFTAPERTLLDLEVAPVGTEYLTGPESFVVLPQPVDALRIHDLAVDLLAADGQTVLLTLDDGGLGEPETSKIPVLAGSGGYFLRVRSTTSTNDIQRYEMRLAFEEGSADAEFIALGASLDDSVGNGNNNGAADPGEEDLRLSIPLRNIGFSPGEPFSAVLVSNTPTAFPTIPNATYAAMAPFESDTQEFGFALSSDHPCGEPVELVVLASHGSGTTEVPITIPTGRPVAAVTYSATNSTTSFIPASSILGAATQIGVSTPGLLSDLDIIVNITHPRLQELLVYMQGPNGQLVELSIGDESGFGGGGATGANMVDTRFDDEAELQLFQGSAPYTGSFRPASQLSRFDNTPAAGAWTLLVANWLGGTTGTLDSWSMEYTIVGEVGFQCDPAGEPSGILDWSELIH